VHGVVPSEEFLAEGTCVREATEARWEVWTVFQRLELGLAEGVGVSRQLHPMRQLSTGPYG
jgi:hypothetical protein